MTTHYLVACQDCGAGRGWECNELEGTLPHPSRQKDLEDHRERVRRLSEEDLAPWLSKFDLLAILDLLLTTEPDDGECLNQLAGAMGRGYQLVTEVTEEEQ